MLKSGKCAYVQPKPAKREDMELVHEPDYIELVRRTCTAGGGVLDLGDTVVNSKSYDVATLAVGALIDALNMVLHKKAKNAFALVRPPGHHAGAYYALGFCLFNNIAIGASHLINRLNLKRILILDIDTHHGNGTQEIFYDTDRVLYISLHEDSNAFPGTGFVDEAGEGRGLGYTVNIPLPLGTDDAIYQRAFDQIVVPMANQYMPEFIMVSAGFDGHYTDPVGDLSLSMKTYDEIFAKIVALADQLCEGKLVATLEGGYSLDFLGKMVASAVARMAHVFYKVGDKRSNSHPRTVRKADEIIKNVKRIQSSYWRL